MEELKSSIIQIEKITLESLNFVKKTPAIQRTNIPPQHLRFEVTTLPIENTLVESRCHISVLRDETQDDFELQLTYLITASVSDASQKDSLEQFAKFGAPFNALVYARDLISSITSRAFGQPAMLPLLDIRNLGKSITFNVDLSQSPSSPSETPAPTE